MADQGRTLSDKLVAVVIARIERRAGHGYNLASLFASQPRGDQGSGFDRGLDDDDTERQA